MSSRKEKGPKPRSSPETEGGPPAADAPVSSAGAPRFEDIFSLEDLQGIQDAFAEAANVASLITDPSGRPVTRPSNFTAFCRDIVRGTEKAAPPAAVPTPCWDGPRTRDRPSPRA